jgi:hypothetical protein
MEIPKLNKSVWLVVVLTLCSTFILAQDKATNPKVDAGKVVVTPFNEAALGISPEERLIRRAYRKLTLFNIAENLANARALSDTRTRREIASGSLRFELTNFRIGPISEIQNSRYRDLSTPPTQEIIQIGTVASTHNREGAKFSVSAKWVSGQYASGMDQNWTIGDILQLESVRFNDVGKYAFYTVRVNLSGRTRTYNALVLFHNSYQSSEPLRPEFLDSIVGMGGIMTEVSKENRIPRGMITRSEMNLIAANSLGTDESKENEKGTSNDTSSVIGNGNECMFSMLDFGSCNCVDFGDGTGYCIPVLVPIPIPGTGYPLPTGCTASTSSIENPQVYQSDDAYHLSGQHHARSRFRMTCQLLSSCQTTCTPLITTQAYADTGILDENFYYHQGATNSTVHSGSGSQNSVVNCHAATGYSFKRCLIDCGLTVQISVQGQGVGVTATATGGDLWNTAHADGRSCVNGQ